MGRLCHLEDVERHRASFDLSRIKVLVKQLDAIEKMMASATDGECSAVKVGDRSDSEDGNMAEVASHPPRTEVRTQGRQGIEGVRTPFKANFYQKLPHFLAQWFKELPVIDGASLVFCGISYYKSYVFDSSVCFQSLSYMKFSTLIVKGSF
jgi:hypothetical protein